MKNNLNTAQHFKPVNGSEKYKKRILVDMSLTTVLHGHVRLLQKASELGHVIVALVSNEEIYKCKGFYPILCFENRKEIALAFKYVEEVIESSWLILAVKVQKQFLCRIIF